MKRVGFLDVDYCQFSDFGEKKPTRIWCCEKMAGLPDRKCDGWCDHMVMGPKGRWVHRQSLGGNHINFSPRQKARMPTALVDYLLQNYPLGTPMEKGGISNSEMKLLEEEMLADTPELEECRCESCTTGPGCETEEGLSEFRKFCKWGLHLPHEEEGGAVQEFYNASVSHISVTHLIATPQEFSEVDAEIEGRRAKILADFPEVFREELYKDPPRAWTLWLCNHRPEPWCNPTKAEALLYAW